MCVQVQTEHRTLDTQQLVLREPQQVQLVLQVVDSEQAFRALHLAQALNWLLPVAEESWVLRLAAER